MKQKLIRLQGETDKSTIVVWDFNNPLSKTIKQENIGKKPSWLEVSEGFLRYNIKSTTHKRKNWYIRLYQNKKLLFCKEICPGAEKISYRLGGNSAFPSERTQPRIHKGL